MEMSLNSHTATAIAEQANAYLLTYRTPPTPQAYEVFYNHAAGTNPELSLEIDTILMAGAGISAPEIARLYKTHVAERSHARRIDQIGMGLGTQIAELRKLIFSASRSTECFGTSLESADKELASERNISRVNAVISSLLSATREMSQTNSQLSANFDRSKQQLEDLNESLKLVRFESLTDPLTKVANRRRFDLAIEDCVDKAASTSESLSLLIIDIDNFKQFNDSFGHHVGDAVLKLTGRAIKGQVKGQDLVARLGGEEFAVVLPATPLKSALIVAEHLRKNISSMELKRKSSGETFGQITVSIGVAAYQAPESTTSFMEGADRCLYACKSAGRNTIQWEPDTGANARPSSIGGFEVASAHRHASHG